VRSLRHVAFDGKEIDGMKPWFAPALLAISLTFATSSLHAAEKACSTATLQGSFGYTVTGFSPVGPFAAVGRLVFNGSGLVTTVRTLSNAGNIVRGDSGSGTYIVGADCTGSFTITASGLGQLQVDIVVDSDGDELRGIVTNPGFTLTLEGRKKTRK
jgi:hypothetical protein